MTGRPISPELRDDLRAAISNAYYEARNVPGKTMEHAADDAVEAVLPIVEAVDENARGGEWVDLIRTARPTAHGPSVLALARMLEDEESTPEPLRTIAAAFLRTTTPEPERTRSSDPETSQTAARRVGPAKPGGTVHKLLRAYRKIDGWQPAHRVGMTSREAEVASGVKAAHKRTSELLRAGLLDVVDALGDDGRPNGALIRAGSRVLSITDAGVDELARLDAAESRA